MRWRSWAGVAVVAGGGLLGTALLAVAAVCLGSGCSTLGYYAQAANGHLDLLQRSRPVADWLEDDSTAPGLRERLELSQRMRDFAVSELKLPDNRSYRRYADLGRNAVVWNVVAAPELSLQLKTWCFAFTGCIGYRGYFRKEAADEMAAALRAEGYEVSVYGVPAYSTLGRTDWLGGDPLLNTFIRWPEGELARLIFHELAHQVVYVDDDTTFNESFATAVERIGGARWLLRHATQQARDDHASLLQRREDFRELTQRYRDTLAALYATALPDDTKRERKATLLAALRAEHAHLKATRWGGDAGYDRWFADVNNASLGVLGAYNDLVPGFERVFDAAGGDFERFYEQVRQIAGLPREQRRAKLQAAP